MVFGDDGACLQCGAFKRYSDIFIKSIADFLGPWAPKAVWLAHLAAFNGVARDIIMQYNIQLRACAKVAEAVPVDEADSCDQVPLAVPVDGPGPDRKRKAGCTKNGGACKVRRL